MQTGFKTIDSLSPKHLNKIDGVEDYRDSEDGFWIHLKSGWSTSNNTHSIHENTISECVSYLKVVKPCNCSECQK